MLRTHHLIPPLRHLPSGSGVCQVSARHSSSLRVALCPSVQGGVPWAVIGHPSKAGLVVAAARRLIEEEPHVRRREVATGLRIIENLPPHAHYSWIFDFEDEDGWRAYMSAEPHHRFAEVVTPYLESAIMTVRVRWRLIAPEDTRLPGSNLTRPGEGLAAPTGSQL